MSSGPLYVGRWYRQILCRESESVIEALDVEEQGVIGWSPLSGRQLMKEWVGSGGE